MIFNKHNEYAGCHAFLSASGYHWINYDREKLKNSYLNMSAKEMGTKLHDFAHQCIVLKQKLPKSKKTLNSFVNDAIGFCMESEQILYYSDNCFGTADAISFRNNFLRIHDLKTGFTPAHMEQLEIYAALFCLEYKYKPSDIKIELRIYQSDEIIILEPDPKVIYSIMQKIVDFDMIINKLKMEE